MSAEVTTASPLMRAEKITKRYSQLEVLKGVDFAVNRGQVKAILGPSGSGKSTLLRIMAMLEQPDSGDLYLEDQRIGSAIRGGKAKPLREATLAHQRRDIGMVFQRFNLFPHLDALHNVMLALTNVQKVSRSEASDKAMEYLTRVGLKEKAKQYPSELSGGQQQRVAIARALVLSPKIMLFDEPTSALDPELVGEVLDVMEGLADDGMTMVVVTHEVRFARRAADLVTLFDDGVIVEQAEPEAFFENPQHERTKKFLSYIH
jgi:ABC-type polar amino acid transport system ATPase subunit